MPDSQQHKSNIDSKLTLSREKRLRKKLDFLAIKKDGSKYYSEHLIICIKKSELSYPRIGVIVSKKVSKRAVDRNLIKRRLREIFRLNQHNFEPGDMLLIAKKNCLNASYADLSQGLLRSLAKAKVFTPESLKN